MDSIIEENIEASAEIAGLSRKLKDIQLKTSISAPKLGMQEFGFGKIKSKKRDSSPTLDMIREFSLHNTFRDPRDLQYTW